MAEATPARSIGGYSTSRALSEDELAEWNRQAEARRAKIREDSLRMIGRDADGKPFPPVDAGEEEWLASADLRAPLRQAIAKREQIASRLADQKAAAERARQHLDAARSALAILEDAETAGSRLAADQLAAQLRSGTVETVASADPDPTTSTRLDQGRRAADVAQAAVDQLTGEAEATARELQQARGGVGAAVLDVLRGEILAIGRQVAALDHQAATLRANLERAGIVTANLAVRNNWRAARIITSSTLAAMHPAPPARPLAPMVDWQSFIGRLFNDAAAELE